MLIQELLIVYHHNLQRLIRYLLNHRHEIQSMENKLKLNNLRRKLFNKIHFYDQFSFI